jgi:signal transduction histidine kinase
MMFSSLRFRLTLLFVVLTIIPLVIVGTLIARRGFETLEDRAGAFQEQLARQTSISLGAFFNERRNELFTLTDVFGLASLDADAQKGVLLALLSKQPAYYEVSMVDADGQETIRLTRGALVTTADLANRADDPLFKEALDSGKISFSPVYFNEGARDRLITIAVPIQDLFTGKTGNVLIAELRFQNVEESVLRDLNLQHGEDVYVVDSQGVVIAHRNPSLVLKETVFNLPEANGRHAGLSGDDVILAMDPIHLGNLDLIVVAETSYANATALAIDLRRLAVIITVTTLLVAGAIVIFSVSRVVRPITKIAQVAQTIRGGNLSVQADETGAMEIATLGRAFNGMTAQLRQTLKGLEDHVAELEKARVEREKLITDLEAAKRLAEENSRLKSEFLSTMSHELRTPLNAIEGFTGIILNKFAGAEFNGKTEGYLNRIQSNSKRLLHLINDFLDLSRVEAGRLELANQPFSPEKLAKRWQEEVSVLAESKGLGFDVTVDSTLPETLYGDEEAISKVALNLLGNAIKFTEQGQVKLALARSNGAWGFSVEDTGIGIPPHAREFIFEEFRQVDQTSKRKYGGTGLGLAIVQKYTRAMGGTVQVKSELGKGSTFSVSLPLKTNQN